MTVDVARALQHVAAGNEAYGRSDFGAAIASYESAVGAGAGSADVLFNLGNAYYRAGQLGKAVLSYERVLRQSPGDEDARHNLRLIRAQSRDQVIQGVEEPFWDRLGGRAHPDLAAGGFAGAWVLGCVLLLLRPRVRALLARLAVTGVAIACLIAAAGAGAVTWAVRDVRSKGQAVVVAEEAEVLEAPQRGAKVAFDAHEGLKVRVAARANGFAKVELPTGLSGWVADGALELIDGGG